MVPHSNLTLQVLQSKFLVEICWPFLVRLHVLLVTNSRNSRYQTGSSNLKNCCVNCRLLCKKPLLRNGGRSNSRRVARSHVVGDFFCEDDGVLSFEAQNYRFKIDDWNTICDKSLQNQFQSVKTTRPHSGCQLWDFWTLRWLKRRLCWKRRFRNCSWSGTSSWGCPGGVLLVLEDGLG